MSRSVILLIVGCAVGLFVAYPFAFTLIGFIGEIVALAVAVVLIVKVAVRVLHR